jgi:predicted kinase
VPSIFVIVGPPAVGKSTTARALAGRFPLGLHIPVDDLRMMVVSGLALPAAEWSHDLERQVALAREAASHMALSYRNAGFTVVLDDFWDPNRLADYRPLFSQPDMRKIVLFPDQAAAHHRNLKRSGDSQARAYIDQGIRDVYRQLGKIVADLAGQGWLVVDTTGLNIDRTVDVILAASSSPHGESQ